MAAGIAPIPSWSGGAVGHEVGDELADPALHVAELWPIPCSYGGTSTSTARSMSSTWMKLSPSVRGIARLSWTMTVFGRADRGVHRLDRDAEGAEAVGIGWRRIDEDRIERERPRVE